MLAPSHQPDQWVDRVPDVSRNVDEGMPWSSAGGVKSSQTPETAPFISSDTQPTRPYIYNGCGKSKQLATGVHSVSSSSTYDSGSQGKCDWLPVTLRMSYLVVLLLASLILAVVTAALTIYSTLNHGLGTDGNSSALRFGWRYAPTIFAVLFVVLVSTMSDDIRRTETFARMSIPGGSSASETVNIQSRRWWNDPFDALNKQKNNGKTSRALLLSAAANLLALLVISPLSAGLLSTVTVSISNETPFKRVEVSEDLQKYLPVDSLDPILFRTTSATIINSSTSAWLTNDFAVLPFWPSDSDLPLAATFPGNSVSRRWIGETIAYKTDLVCTDITFVNMKNVTITTTTNYTDGIPVNGSYGFDTDYDGFYIELGSNDGCIISILVDEVLTGGASTWLGDGGGTWSRPPYYNNTNPFLTGSTSHLMEGAGANGTSECGERTLFFVNSPWRMGVAFKLAGKLCTSSYLQANVSATVAITDSNTTVTFDPEEFRRNQQPIDTAKYGISQLEKSFFDFSWPTKFFLTGTGTTFEGPVAAVAALGKYGNDWQALLNSLTLVNDMRMIQQRFFGEMLLSALTTSGVENPQSITGTIRVTERRIAVTFGVGVVLSVLFLFVSCCIAGITFFTRLSRRPLNLSHEPASIAGATSLIATTKRVQGKFESSDRLPQASLTAKLQHLIFFLKQGNLSAHEMNRAASEHNGSAAPSEKELNKDPRPTVLRGWVAPALLLFLLALLAGIVALYKISRNGGLHQAAVVYESNIGSITAFAPYSIIPTLLAVGVKLWFGVIEETLKRLQPFASILKTPAGLSKSLLVEYANAPLIFTSVKAMKNSHWVLCVVGVVALTTEIFTVGMSALFDKEPTTLSQVLNMPRQLELRVIPEIYTSDQQLGRSGNPIPRDILGNLFASSSTGWLYSATVEINHNASSPQWSKDDWSFVPLDLSGYHAPSQISNANGKVSIVADLVSNITLRTQAIRARLECSLVEEISNISLWLNRWDFKNSKVSSYSNETIWNTTNSPPGLDVGYQLRSAILGPGGNYSERVAIGASETVLTCCSNVTNNVPGDAAIGYWTDNTTSQASLFHQIYDNYRPSMVAKWIVGRPLNGTFEPYDLNIRETVWIWENEPKLMAMKCSPIIEKANASVVLDAVSGAVQRYTVLDDPKPAPEAWSDSYIQRPVSVTNTEEQDPLRTQNYTVSYGVLFWEAMLNAAVWRTMGFDGPDVNTGQISTEMLDDRIFNIRSTGLNVDLMSFAMLSQANNNKEDLLDPVKYTKHANSVFSTFFKHFASQNVTTERGGRVYQQIGENLPWDLPLPDGANKTTDKYTQNITSTTPRTAEATLGTPVEALTMSLPALWLCITIIAFLCLSTVAIYAVDRRKFKALPRDVDTLGSVLGFVYGSEKLLEWVRENADSKTWNQVGVEKKSILHSGYESELKVKMGPFEGRAGEQRWGIEIVE